MTLYGWGNPRYFPRLPAPVHPLLRRRAAARASSPTATGRRARGRTPTLLLLHGLNASSDAHYMKGIATKAFARGMNVVRLNQRNCGGTEHLSEGLFHSGLTADAAHVIDELTAVDGLPAIAVAGYSLGGNLALKLAGDYADHPPRVLRAVCAVSPILEISLCVHALERPENRIYQWNFVRDLKARMRRKERYWPGLFDLTQARRDPHGPRVRRRLHGAALRLRGRRGLLPPRERDARHRSRPRAGARHHRRGRPVRPARSVPRSDGHRQPAHHAAPLPRTAATAASSARGQAKTMGIGRKIRLWSSSMARMQECTGTRYQPKRTLTDASASTSPAGP